MDTLESPDLDAEALEYSTDNVTLDATCGEEDNSETKVSTKKKKKKKPKKSAKAKEEAALNALDIAEVIVSSAVIMALSLMRSA